MDGRHLLIVSFVASCMALDTIQYGAFTATATYSVANQLGFFEAFDLDVVFNVVPSSVSAFNSLLGGDFDILTATVDNALNFRFNLDQNVTVLGQLDQGPDLVVASIPSITNFSQLEGLPIMVDSPTSGYAFLLRDVLKTHDLELENGDFFFMTVGGTETRFAALTAGALANGSAAFATILTYPFTIEGESLPMGQAPVILERVSDLVVPITSTAFTISEPTLQNSTKVSLLTRFLAAMFGANQFLLDPNRKSCSIQAIASQDNLTTDVATQEYASAISNLTGEVSPGSNFTVNLEGITNVINVRTDFDGFSGLPSDFNWTAALQAGPGNLIDYNVRDMAVQLFNESPYFGNCTLSDI